MNILALDCETVGIIDHGDEDAIAELAEKAAKTPIDYVATSPLLATVVCVGFKWIEGGSTPGAFAKIGSEAEILGECHAILELADRLVTFNGRGFDLPLLMYRSLRHGIQPAQSVINAIGEPRHAFEASYDVMDRISGCGAMKPVSLRHASIGLLKRDPKASGDGRSVAAMYHAGKLDDIAKYCCGDVEATADLYRVLTSSEPKYLDAAKKIVVLRGVPCFAFGQHSGKPVESQPEFARWMLGKDFPEETKAVLRKILETQRATS